MIFTCNISWKQENPLCIMFQRSAGFFYLATVKLRIIGYTIFHDWTIVENSIVLDMGSTLLICLFESMGIDIQSGTCLLVTHLGSDFLNRKLPGIDQQ